MQLYEMSAFVAALSKWFATACRPLPWRGTYEPYAVWISEIMLQQTQMERGVAYFTRWMQRFPTVQSVAQAEEADILAAWEGLGYYSRARSLHKAAKLMVQKHGGQVPADYEAIRALPGVGPYTAGAIASIAFDIPAPAVDANVLRISARVRDDDRPTDNAAMRFETEQWVRQLLEHGSARTLAQALMELGALVCSKSPKCGQCPVWEYCLADKRGTVSRRPVLLAKKEYQKLCLAAVVLCSGKRVLLRRRPQGGLWGGLWELPQANVQPGADPQEAAQELAGTLAPDAVCKQALPVVQHGFTTRRVTLHGWVFALAARKFAPVDGFEWVDRKDIPGLPFSAGCRKIFEHLGWKNTP